MELLEAEMRRWAVPWDVVGLAETWLDEDSEKGLAVVGYSAVCASRKRSGGGGVALLIREGRGGVCRTRVGGRDQSSAPTPCAAAVAPCAVCAWARGPGRVR